MEEQIYEFWVSILKYIPNKDRDTAIEESLNILYESDIIDLPSFYNYVLSVEEEDDLIGKKIKRFIRENALYEDCEEEEW